MIYGVGTDIVEISRIEKSMKSQRFINKVFSEKEIELLKKCNFSSETAAANFCAKEAFSKALGTGIRGFALNEVSVLRDEFDKPYIELSGNALKIGKNLNFYVSLSHTKEYATAFAVAEKE